MGELRDRMVRDMEVRNFSPRTIEAYVPWVRDLAKHYMRAPDQLADDEVQNYLLQLHSERKLSSSTCQQAYSALKFFYAVTVRRPHASLLVPVRRGEQKLPEILSCQEVQRIIEASANLRHRVLLMATYAGGLRVSEAVALRPADIDVERGVIRIEQGKGRKDRYTVLSERLVRELSGYYRVYHPRPTQAAEKDTAAAPLALAPTPPPSAVPNAERRLCPTIPMRLWIRHSGESRNPEATRQAYSLDAGLRRHDGCWLVRD